MGCCPTQSNVGAQVGLLVICTSTCNLPTKWITPAEHPEGFFFLGDSSACRPFRLWHLAKQVLPLIKGVTLIRTIHLRQNLNGGMTSGL